MADHVPWGIVKVQDGLAANLHDVKRAVFNLIRIY